VTPEAVPSEAWVRLSFFASVFLAMASWETLAPLRPWSVSKVRRWFTNLAIAAINAAALRLIFPAAAVGVAWQADQRGLGVLNQVEVPYWFSLVITLLAFDFVVYLQHVVFHAIPALWRLHRVHHADLDFDVTTGARFHPLEILLSMLVKSSAIMLLGPPATAVLVFEALLNATSMFNHGNVRVPTPLDRALRLFLVTPDMHRVHHSVVTAETNSNFGFNLPWWDRLLGTYRAQPQAGHLGMTIGIAELRDLKTVTLPRVLALPFAHDEAKASRIQA
jgi:sterol desaturase/sphingolipid hydroxylase (fatty acid hydroxylase superfamily)